MNTNPMLLIAIVVSLLASQFNYKKSTIDDNFEVQSSLLSVEYNDSIENDSVAKVEVIFPTIDSKAYKNVISNHQFIIQQLIGSFAQIDFKLKKEKISSVDIDAAQNFENQFFNFDIAETANQSTANNIITLPEIKTTKASKS